MDFENQKTCGACSQTKPLDCFPRNKVKKDGYGAQCKECQKVYSRNWYAKNRDSVLKKQKQYYADNNEACKAARAKYAKANPEKMREYGRKRSRKKLPEPTRPCPTHCEMCHRTSKRALHLDHDHITGEFRGWLCGCCNTAFGRLGDDFEIAIQRLNHYQSVVKRGKRNGLG